MPVEYIIFKHPVPNVKR